MAFEDGLNYFPDVTDADLLNASDYTQDEKVATQAARNRLRKAGVVESSPGVFVKSYGMTAAEQAAYDQATSIPAVFGQIGTTIGNGFSAAPGIWDGLNKTLVIVSVLVGVLTLGSLLRK